MKEIRIAPLVEGDGEVSALPILIRRIVQTINPAVTPIVPQGFRHPSGSLLKPGGVERAINAVSIRHPNHAVLLQIDCEDNCPGSLGPHLLHRARESRPDLRVSVVLAHCEYEAWFLSAAESLAGRRGLRKDLTAPTNPEHIRDAKGWLSRQMPPLSRYSPTQDQAAFSAQFDLQLARERSRSFRKLWKEIESLLAP